MTHGTYVAYSEEVEQRRPDEDEQINTIVDAGDLRQPRRGLQQVQAWCA